MSVWQQLFLNVGTAIGLLLAIGWFAVRKWWPDYVQRRDQEEKDRREHLEQLREILSHNTKVGVETVGALASLKQSVDEGNRSAEERHRYIEQAIVELRPVRSKRR
jgi:CMP-2-keto-3-deoxyoctulosonic acid synthetase